MMDHHSPLVEHSRSSAPLNPPALDEGNGATTHLVSLSMTTHSGWKQLSWVLVVGWMTCCFTGCSLFVMAGKMFFGDPQTASAFTQVTGVDLAKEKKSVVIVCSVPNAARTELSSLDLELLEGLSRQLKVRGVKVADPDQVATWMDDNGGYFDPNNPEEFAESFPDVDYIIHVDVERFSYHEENSPNMFRGRLGGAVSAYEVRNPARNTEKTKKNKNIETGIKAFEVFKSDITSVYPTNNPQSIEQISGELFLSRYVSRISNELTLMFASYRPSETVF